MTFGCLAFGHYLGEAPKLPFHHVGRRGLPLDCHLVHDHLKRRATRTAQVTLTARIARP